MVKVRYVGIREPESEFEALRPAYSMVIAMMTKCRPFSPEYEALLKISEAMNDAAQQFMPGVAPTSFFGARPTG